MLYLHIHFFQLLQEGVSVFVQEEESVHLVTSRKTNSNTVLGANRTKAGVHPLNKNRTPSLLRELLTTESMDSCSRVKRKPLANDSITYVI
jgi:hypothetical protein